MRDDEVGQDVLHQRKVASLTKSAPLTKGAMSEANGGFVTRRISV